MLLEFVDRTFARKRESTGHACYLESGNLIHPRKLLSLQHVRGWAFLPAHAVLLPGICLFTSRQLRNGREKHPLSGGAATTH